MKQNKWIDSKASSAACQVVLYQKRVGFK